MQHKQELLSSFEVREIIKIGSESNQLFSLRSASRGSSVLFRFILRTTDPSSAAILTACLAEHDGIGCKIYVGMQCIHAILTVRSPLYSW